MLMSLIHGYVRAHEMRRSMGWMLQRADDRLLDDMGITRDDLKRMMENADSTRKATRPALRVATTA